MKIELPSEVTKEATAEFKRLISPLCEGAELLSDKIRFYRFRSALLALREAKRLAKESDIDFKNVPIKFLVPFLENCSLEDEDSELINLWANLLTSAADSYDSSLNTFTKILSEIGPREASLLKNIIQTADESIFSYSRIVRQMLDPIGQISSLFHDMDCFEDSRHATMGFDEIQSIKFQWPISVLECCFPIRSDSLSGTMGLFVQSDEYQRFPISFDIMDRQRLIGIRRRDVELKSRRVISVTWAEATFLALDFYRSCVKA